MKKFITPLVIATQVGATIPQFSSANANVFKSDSVARRMLIEDAVDGKLGIGTVEKAYPYAKTGGDLERAMWLALMKEPILLELYIGQGMGRDVKVVYPLDILGTARDIATAIMFFGAIGILSWIEYSGKQQQYQIIINTNGK